MILETPLMAEHGESNSTKSSACEPWSCSTGFQSRQAHHILLLPARISQEAPSFDCYRSTSIPLPSSHVPRTQSELQLDQDEEVANQRDMTMFYRLVNGIREHQLGIPDEQLSQSERSLRSIVNVRQPPGRDQQDHARSGADDHRFHFQQRTGAALYHISPIAEASPHAADEWSISGFNEQPPMSFTSLNYQVQGLETETQDVVDTDLEIFDMDP